MTKPRRCWDAARPVPLQPRHRLLSSRPAASTRRAAPGRTTTAPPSVHTGIRTSSRLLARALPLPRDTQPPLGPAAARRVNLRDARTAVDGLRRHR